MEKRIQCQQVCSAEDALGVTCSSPTFNSQCIPGSQSVPPLLHLLAFASRRGGTGERGEEEGSTVAANIFREGFCCFMLLKRTFKTSVLVSLDD